MVCRALTRRFSARKLILTCCKQVLIIVIFTNSFTMLQKLPVPGLRYLTFLPVSESLAGYQSSKQFIRS